MSDQAKTSVVRVMSGLALEVAVNRWLKPQFEAESDFLLEMDWRPTAAIMKSIDAGQRADMVIAISDPMDRLVEAGIVVAKTRAPLADAVLGVGVLSGAPRPDVSTLEAFKAAMVGARAVAYSQAGASGIYFAKLIDKLGIGDAVRAKGVTIPMGFTGEKVVSGEAELAIQQVSELMTVKGIDVAGPFPAEIQVASRFDAAIFADAANPDGARALLEMLTSPAAHEAYGNGGLVSRLQTV
ncbi:MAG: substrate-binding domain-containing protein [Hyphomicrobiaceae bacterium]